MAKKGGSGSQLAQLKSRLHNEGVTDRRQMKASAKKRKRGMASSERDEEQARRDKLSRIASSSQFNPFEEKVTKPKNAVLGRQVRGAKGRPGEARQGGLRARAEKLLPEWLNRSKSGSFVDRRFGEGDGGNMSVDDKMLERFTHERQKKASKASLFNLNDAEEEGLTHYGRSLNDLDEYDDIHLSDEETGEDKMAHFGGFDEEKEKDEDRQKSKAEVMKEVIAKSKMHKQERQQVKMADEELRQQLDEEFGDLRSLLMAPATAPIPASTPKAPEEEDPEAERPLFGMNKGKEDAYDTAVREMIFERRAKPQDRLKTEAEKAQELAEKLQKAEDDRRRRMRGEEVSDDEGQGRGKKGKRSAGGDDLEDDFELDGMTSSDVYGLGQGLRAEQDEEESADDEEVEDAGDDGSEVDEEQDEDEDDDEESDEDDGFEDLADVDALAVQGEELDSDADEQENLVGKPKGAKTLGGRRDPAASALPFTFPCPSSLDEMLEILSSNKVATTDVPVVVKRIRALHHSSLAEDNKLKLQTLVGVLVDYVLHLAVHMDTANKAQSIQVVNALVPQIYTLTKAYPIASSEHFVGKLALIQRNLTRGLSKGALDPDAKTWPGLPECIFLKLTGAIWPTSDRVHSVTTPLGLLVGQFLSSCRIRTINDIAKGIFLASLIIDHERQSKRIVPEALNFLHNAISLLAPISSRKQLARINHQFGIPWPDLDQLHTKALRLGEAVPTEAPLQSLDVLRLLNSSASAVNQSDDALKSHLLSSCFTLVEEYARLYLGSVAFVEMFTPFQMLLTESVSRLPQAWLETARQTTIEHVTRLISNAHRQRRALRLQAHRAVPLASHVPKFDQGFNPERKGGRTFDPDSQRAEVVKLRALAKKERKGAMRELRRDNEFLADARRSAREQEDQRYTKTIDKIMGSLSAERGEEKAYLRDKQRIKRRSGKK